MNEVSIIINGTQYDAVDGVYCTECEFKESCDAHYTNLCYILGVGDCGFKKSDKSLNHEKE